MVQHGTNTCYNRGCRQEECRAAHTAWAADYRKRKAEGGPVGRYQLRTSQQVGAEEALTELVQLIQNGKRGGRAWYVALGQENEGKWVRHLINRVIQAVEDGELEIVK